jgi:hypothetical protein
VDVQLASRPAPAFGLPGFQQKKHLEAALDLGIFLLADELLKPLGRLGNFGEVVHERWHFLAGTIRPSVTA